MKAQRLRVRYSLGAEARELGQRDLIATWEHACREAGVLLAYSEGKRPSPLLSIAAPLSQGATSDCELLDMVLSERASPGDVLSETAAHPAAGIRPAAVEEVGLNGPSLQSQVRWAEYEVAACGSEPGTVRESICRVLEAATLPAEYQREKKVRVYDLRPLILDMNLADRDGETTVVMRLRAEPQRTARPDQVAIALGLPDGFRVHRTRLVLDEMPPVLLSYRRSNSGEET